MVEKIEREVSKHDAILECLKEEGKASKKRIKKYCEEKYGYNVSTSNLHSLINYKKIKPVNIFNKRTGKSEHGGPIYKIRRKHNYVPKWKLKTLLESIRDKPHNFWKTFVPNMVMSSAQTEVMDLIESGEKHIQLNFSRQSGKSTILAVVCLKWLFFNEAERIYLFAPTEDQAKEMYNKIVRLIYDYPFFEQYCERIAFNKGIKAFNGNFIKFMSASPGSHIRGKTATKIILDESGRIIDEKYYGAINPMMAAKQVNKYGEEVNKVMIEAGTPPLGKNHFYYTLQSEEVRKIIQPWYECEHADESFIKKQKSILPEINFRREYLAEFVEEGATCFPSKWWHSKKHKEIDGERMCINESNNRKDCGLSNIELIQSYRCFNDTEDMIGYTEDIKKRVNKNGEYTMGFDNGRQVDHAALCIWRVDNFPVKCVYNRQFALGTINDTIINEMKFLYELYEPCEVNVDWTNEKGFRDLLLDAGIPAPIDSPDYKYGLVVFKNSVKTEMYTNMVNLVQKGLIRLPSSEETLYYQFTQQQYEVSAGKYKFSHPTKSHDDQLWATMLALKNVKPCQEDIEDVGIVNIWKKDDDEKKLEKDYEVSSTGKMKIKGRKIGRFEKLKESKSKKIL